MSDEAPRDEPAGTPRWVKVFAAVALIVVALFVVLIVVGGDHGPSRHGAAAIVAEV